MPGICGIIGRNATAQNGVNLQQMVGTLVHDPSYVSGTYVNHQLGVYAGWANHSNSFSASMPVFNEKKDVVLIFYGENFVDKEITEGLKRRNHIFNSHNASYLVHLYEEKGDAFLLELNGWFTGLLIDLRQARVTLFNDRFGMQRLHYYEDSDAFYFSGEAKSILKVVPEARQLDVRSLGEFFCCDCALENRTLFRGIHLLPQGSAWICSPDGHVEKNRYFDEHLWENQTLLGKEFLFEKVKETLHTIIPRYLRSDQAVGISLTGGLDTRIIMANLQSSPGRYACYTFGGMYRDSFDVKIARKIAELTKQTHDVIKVDAQFLVDFPRYAEDTVYISDGGMDVSGSPDLYINRLARNIAPVRITGNYGSEVMRGVRFLRAVAPHDALLDREFARCAHAAIETHASVASGNRLSFTMFKDLPWHEYGRLAVEQSQLTMRSPFVDNDLVRLMYRAPPEVTRSKEMSLRLVKVGSAALAEIMTDRGIGGTAGAVRKRLARIYREGSFKAEYAYNYGMPQWLALVNHVLEPLHVDKVFLGRHKFHHFRRWFRHELADYLRDVLLGSRAVSREYLNRRVLEHMVLSHTAGTRNYTTEITKVLTAELIHRRLLEDI